jgi:hypothetical protein
MLKLCNQLVDTFSLSSVDGHAGACVRASVMIQVTCGLRGQQTCVGVRTRRTKLLCQRQFQCQTIASITFTGGLLTAAIQ